MTKWNKQQKPPKRSSKIDLKYLLYLLVISILVKNSHQAPKKKKKPICQQQNCFECNRDNVYRCHTCNEGYSLVSLEDFFGQSGYNGCWDTWAAFLILGLIVATPCLSVLSCVYLGRKKMILRNEKSLAIDTRNTPKPASSVIIAPSEPNVAAVNQFYFETPRNLSAADSRFGLDDQILTTERGLIEHPIAVLNPIYGGSVQDFQPEIVIPSQRLPGRLAVRRLIRTDKKLPRSYLGHSSYLRHHERPLRLIPSADSGTLSFFEPFRRPGVNVRVEQNQPARVKYARRVLQSELVDDQIDPGSNFFERKLDEKFSKSYTKNSRIQRLTQESGLISSFKNSRLTRIDKRSFGLTSPKVYRQKMSGFRTESKFYENDSRAPIEIKRYLPGRGAAPAAAAVTVFRSNGSRIRPNWRKGTRLHVVNQAYQSHPSGQVCQQKSRSGSNLSSIQNSLKRKKSAGRLAEGTPRKMLTKRCEILEELSTGCASTSISKIFQVKKVRGLGVPENPSTSHFLDKKQDQGHHHHPEVLKRVSIAGKAITQSFCASQNQNRSKIHPQPQGCCFRGERTENRQQEFRTSKSALEIRRPLRPDFRCKDDYESSGRESRKGSENGPNNPLSFVLTQNQIKQNKEQRRDLKKEVDLGVPFKNIEIDTPRIRVTEKSIQSPKMVRRDPSRLIKRGVKDIGTRPLELPSWVLERRRVGYGRSLSSSNAENRKNKKGWIKGRDQTLSVRISDRGRCEEMKKSRRRSFSGRMRLSGGNGSLKALRSSMLKSLNLDVVSEKVINNKANRDR